ncbi:MAG: hypothetical protein RI516_06725 [Spiribacter sp.]|jgi:hypothetical protein|nr:hypothetical protein [Spiribacter sp.]MDR9480835.1 hypothetical protein [Spiribacter sp.]
MIDTRLLDATPISDGWWLIRLNWNTDEPPAVGQWLWLTLAQRRVCLAIRDHHADEGWIAGILPSADVDQALHAGQAVRVSPIQGEALSIAADNPLMIVGEDHGIAPALALAERHQGAVRLVILGGQQGIPGRLVPSRFYIDALADCAIAGLSALESLGVASRIALSDERPGVFTGSPGELLGRYLAELTASERAALSLVAITPWGRLDTLQRGLAQDLAALHWIQLPARGERA